VRFWALQFEKSFAAILALTILITFISPIGRGTLSSVLTIIQSSGTIGGSQVAATSGSARDIQDAVNIAAAQGIGRVVIPEGIFDFVSVGESWMTVNVPDGVSIFGAPTERTSGLPVPAQGMNPNNQVVTWRTILRMPFEAPEDAIWFNVRGDNVRVSDIKMVGYREINPNSARRYRGFDIRNSANFRIDHVYLRNICGRGVLAVNANGVVDHSKLVNDPFDVYAPSSSCTVWYAVSISGDDWTWEYNIANLLGHYTPYTVFIEDNYFEGWRHTTTANRGGHFVYRYNTERKHGYGTVDGHGGKDPADWLSTRAMEVYNNDFGDVATFTESHHVGTAQMGVQLRGGGGVFFNNIVDGYGTTTSPADYSAFVCMIQYTPNTGSWHNIPYADQQVKDVWIWGNTLTPAGADLWDAGWGSNNPIYENEHFFLRAPDLALDGFEYTPYQYPHPQATE